ncbi:hypothetical protein [Vagococcus xieshaowenii]|uniref:Gram-positive cocci surface proteins LPxTG domain-containing protein n=1 Tax=Vagococcus xieshaowenii TaxID=2562451 RepID=A0A4Z0D3D7_9ENTE|nr:hypothetical protein [Vagococcus xieshaowenii]QCA28952.1 hypothetical protein E4Z98_06340 [Vagococcus xieshaowenii]TFZ39236.1 hypothetical protein E4031_09525 [Vagococcus xieshaowenii]
MIKKIIWLLVCVSLLALSTGTAYAEDNGYVTKGQVSFTGIYEEDNGPAVSPLTESPQKVHQEHHYLPQTGEEKMEYELLGTYIVLIAIYLLLIIKNKLREV